jgi:surface polysaccharide O-acyltransferase-like enzyme
MDSNLQVKPIDSPQDYLPIADSLPRSGRADFLDYIHNFRAIAILMIVGVHCLDFLNWTAAQQPTRNIFDDILANGSLVFVFIAGFLFQHLSSKFTYSVYLKKKFFNVLLPYALLSVPAIYYSGFYKGTIPEEGLGALIHGVRRIVYYYVVGGAHVNYPYWFIPMIAIFYVLAPIFMKLIKNPKLYFSLAILAPVSFFVHRPPFPHLNPIHNALYFGSAYVLGMLCSNFKEKAYNFIDQRLSLFIGMYILCFSMYFISGDHGIHIAKNMFSQENGYIDIPYIEKVLFSFILFVLLKKFNHFKPRFLKYIADVSFSIYFIHIYVLMVIRHMVKKSFLAYGSWMSWGILFVLTVVSCSIIAWVLKRLLGKKSRSLIGS